MCKAGKMGCDGRGGGGGGGGQGGEGGGGGGGGGGGTAEAPVVGAQPVDGQPGEVRVCCHHADGAPRHILPL